MKKRIVKLNESDLELLVKKIIREEEMDPNSSDEGDNDEEGSKLVKDFFNKMSSTSAVMTFFNKIADRTAPKPKAEAIVRFAEMVGVPKGQIASIIGSIRDASKEKK